MKIDIKEKMEDSDRDIGTVDERHYVEQMGERDLL